MQYQCDEPIVIDLDDPAPRGARLLGVSLAILVMALILAPYVMDTAQSERVDTLPVHQARSASQAEYCQPSFELPGALSGISHLAMPSFLRLCDWFGPQAMPPPDEAPIVPVRGQPGPEY